GRQTLDNDDERFAVRLAGREEPQHLPTVVRWPGAVCDDLHLRRRPSAGYFVAFISAAAFVALFARRVPAGYFLAGS
ncbi:MAG: hypothetical protein WAL04_00345, partial [Acidimicrobiales bacterium]